MSSTAAALVAVGLAMPLAACGGSATATTETAPAAEEPLASAVQATRDGGTAAVVLRFEGTEATGPADTLTGRVDFARQRAEVGSSVDRVIVTPAALYLAAPELPAGKWVRHELAREPKADFVPDMLYGRLDPVRLLAFLERSAAVFEEIGFEQVHGVETVVYRGYAETALLLRELVPASHRGEAGSGAASEVLVDAWVDDAGRLRRVLYDFPVANIAFGRRATVELSDFGSKVSIPVPRGDALVEGTSE
jgi:hypothetical protein